MVDRIHCNRNLPILRIASNVFVSSTIQRRDNQAKGSERQHERKERFVQSVIRPLVNSLKIDVFIATISAAKRLVKNPILMFHLVGSTIRYIGLGGFYIFKTKYIESQYRQSSSSASLITGSTSILPMAIGIILGGVGITFAKPKPRTLVIYMFLVEFVSNAAIFSGMFLGCPAMEISQFLDTNNQYVCRSIGQLPIILCSWLDFH